MTTKKKIQIVLAAGLVLTLGACSSSKTKRKADDTATPAAAADAGTDAVPQVGAENPSPPDANADQAPEVPAAEAQADATPPSPAGSGEYDDYTVQAGDTLMKIAFETYGDLYRWKGILDANKDKITDPNRIPAGTVLKVEKPATPVEIEKNGEKYRIKNGDTLGTISQDVYGTKTKWKALWENNKQMIQDPNRIFAGFYLYYQPDANAPQKDNSTVTPPAPMANAAAPTTTTSTAAPMDSNRAPASAASTPSISVPDAPPPPPPGMGQ